MSLRTLLKNSVGGATNTSSKRILMYQFALVADVMVAIQALFTLILIWKWSHAVADAKGVLPKFEIYSVFPDVIWYCVFGLIAGLAGINGIKDGFGKQTPKVDKLPDDEEIN